MPCSCDRRGMWDRRVSIGPTLNENAGMSTLEPLMELIIEHCPGKYNHSIDNEMVRAEGEIDNLTMEKYLALTRGNHAPGVVKPEIGGNVNFEIKSQFMQELREDTFSGNKNDDVHEHVERVLDIVSLFNIPGVSHDAVMLRVFPITLTGATKRWVDIIPLGIVDSWDFLKKAFIQRGAHLDKDYPLKEEVKSIEEAKYGEFGRPSPFSNGAKGINTKKDRDGRMGKETPDLGANVNVIPKSIIEYLKLAQLKKTDLLVEMTDIKKRSSIGIVENVLVKIDKFLFPPDFVVMDMLNIRNETMILGRPFLATIHADIDVFNKEFSLGIGGDIVTFNMDKTIHEYTIPIGEIYMINTTSNTPSDALITPKLYMFSMALFNIFDHFS
ncbi:putative reverse transcriptase domain-containing protein [Tanacetum coccineum]